MGMTTLRTTSGRLRLRMLRARLLDLSPLLFLMEESRPPPTLLITTMDLLPRSPMRAPLSIHLSLRKDMDMLPLFTNLPLHIMLKDIHLSDIYYYLLKYRDCR